MKNIPEDTFLKEDAISEYSQHRLYLRQIVPLKIDPLDDKSPEITLKRGGDILEYINEHLHPIKWWIGVGTALGYSREKAFIPGETDLDIRVALDF